MKSLASLLWAGALLSMPLFAAEDKIAVEFGPGNHWSKGADAVFLRYVGEHRFPNFPEQPAFYEISIGSWSGHDNSSLALAIGTKWYLNQFHFDIGGGLAYLAHETRMSGTHQQFILRYGIGVDLGRVGVGLYQTHYSNFRDIFDWDGPNVGYDFLTFQMSYALK